MRLQSAHLRWWLRTIGPKKKPFSRALRHTRLVMLDRLKRPLHLVKTHHTPLALTLDQLHAIETTYGDDYARCMRHTFRAADDIYHPDLLAIHGLMTDLVVPTWMRRSHLLYFHLGVDPFETLTRVSQNRHWFVNIDDKVGSSPQVVARLRAALDAVYPGPATFEIAACRSGRQKSHATAPTTPKVEPPWDQDEPPQ